MRLSANGQRPCKLVCRLIIYPQDFRKMLESIWYQTLEQLNDSMPTSKTMWLDYVTFKQEDGDVVHLECNSSMTKSNFEKNCMAEVLNLMEELSGRHIILDVAIASDESTTGEPAQEAPANVGTEKVKARRGERHSLLNPAYTFDSFIPCESTMFAYNAAKAIAMHPGMSYNPCLIYGGVGLGKTHLLESIGNYVEKENPRKNVVYVTAETFTNDYIQSLTDKNTSQFRIKYRKADILLIDDIHFLEKKIQTQEELFHTFNDLYETSKQIVFTCDRPIVELKGFTDRLKSRFTRGLNINLTAPDYETRVAILKKKCEEKHVVIDDGILDYIAQNIKTNVRDLEGSLTTLIAYSSLIKSRITLEIAQEQLKNIISSPMAGEQDISISSIVKEVASYFNVDIADIKGKKRTAIIKDARNIAIYLTRRITQYSTTEIGTYFDRDHSTITHSIDKVETEKKTNSELAAALDSLETRIRTKAK